MLDGGCRCGAVRYTLAMAALPATYACHCLDCHTMSGTAFVLQAPVAEARLAVRGTTVAWRHEGPRGSVAQHFCGSCFTRLFSSNGARPGVALLRAGTLDRSAELAPVLHIWTKRKQRWIVLPDGVPAYDGAAPAAVTARLFAANFA